VFLTKTACCFRCCLSVVSIVLVVGFDSFGRVWHLSVNSCNVTIDGIDNYTECKINEMKLLDVCLMVLLFINCYNCYKLDWPCVLFRLVCWCCSVECWRVTVTYFYCVIVIMYYLQFWACNKILSYFHVQEASNHPCQ
jgi:hypothetical protein